MGCPLALDRHEADDVVDVNGAQNRERLVEEMGLHAHVGNAGNVNPLIDRRGGVADSCEGWVGLAAPGDDHAGPFGGEALGDRPADAARAAGYECRLAIKLVQAQSFSASSASEWKW